MNGIDSIPKDNNIIAIVAKDIAIIWKLLKRSLKKKMQVQSQLKEICNKQKMTVIPDLHLLSI